MQKSKTFLPDVNVLLALGTARHVHSGICSAWLDRAGSEQIFICRITQMGLLRLLTNATVMGKDVLASREAWGVYGTMLADSRFGFAPEPFAIEEAWKKIMTLDRPANKLWTDAYLVAFARSAGMRLVTLDRGILVMEPEALLLNEA